MITHYHRDHVGGVPQLAARMKILNFVDHGPNMEDSKVTKEDYSDYVKTIQRGEHVVVKPGDMIPIKDLKVEVLAADGQVLRRRWRAPGSRTNSALLRRRGRMTPPRTPGRLAC